MNRTHWYLKLASIHLLFHTWKICWSHWLYFLWEHLLLVAINTHWLVCLSTDNFTVVQSHPESNFCIGFLNLNKRFLSVAHRPSGTSLITFFKLPRGAPLSKLEVLKNFRQIVYFDYLLTKPSTETCWFSGHS